MNQTTAQPGSAYVIEDKHDPVRSHTLTVLVDNEPGVLARVIGLFAGRGYNIESLTVAETDHASHLSRITIVTTGTPQVIEQIKAQLGRVVAVHDVHDLTVEGRSVDGLLWQQRIAFDDVAGARSLRSRGSGREQHFRGLHSRPLDKPREHHAVMPDLPRARGHGDPVRQRAQDLEVHTVKVEFLPDFGDELNLFEYQPGDRRRLLARPATLDG